MTWEAIGALGDIVGAFAVLVSLLYLAVQIRQNTASIRSSTYQSAVTSISQVSLGIGTDEGSAYIAHAGFTRDIAELTDQEQFRFGLILTGMFRNYENFWYQYRSGVMEEHVWQGVRNAMIGYLQLPSVKSWWAQRSSIFSPKFVQYLALQANVEKESR